MAHYSRSRLPAVFITTWNVPHISGYISSITRLINLGTDIDETTLSHRSKFLPVLVKD